MRSIWIQNTNLGFKKIIALYVTLLLIFYLIHQANISSILYFYSGFVSCLTLALSVLVYYQGIYVSHAVFHYKKNIYQVRDAIFFRKQVKNHREVFSTVDGYVMSRIYLHPQKQWAYFDALRAILEKQKQVKKVLILGGGGGAIPRTIAQQFPHIQVTVVEISKKMIEVAQKFFVQDSPQIKFIHGDAFDFVRQNKNKYDLVCLDVFNGGILCREVAQQQFIAKLCKLAPLTVINFGFDYPNLTKYTKPYNLKKRNIALHFVGINLLGWNKRITVPTDQAVRISAL